VIQFDDRAAGHQSYVAGRDFGDFVVWRNEGVAAYQLACVVDDFRMGITEVVRGEDLLVSTARQILLYRALGWQPPAFVHCPLVRDPSGQRLAKRHDSLSLRHLRRQGTDPRALLASWQAAQP
jgi:glutamyl-tRNA synthetase